MSKKYNIQVRNDDGTVVETIQRAIKVVPIGNYCPLFCSYRGRDRLVESDELHLDDPARAVESDHIDKMFIRPRDENGRVVATWGEAKQAKQKTD
jgi:hypothetical protein